MKGDEMAFRKELEDLINRESMENGSDTPDFILADFLCSCLEAFDSAVKRRTRWYSHAEQPSPETVQPKKEEPSNA
jgi:hypothetical protein